MLVRKKHFRFIIAVFVINILPSGLHAQDWRVPGSQRAAVEGSSSNNNNYYNNNNSSTRTISKKRQEEIDRINNANKTKDNAYDAANRGDITEAIRLAEAAQDLAKDHKWLSSSIIYWKRLLTYKAANEANRRGDVGRALDLYHQLLNEDPNYFTEEGKKIIHDLEIWYDQEMKNKKTVEEMQKDILSLAPGKKDTVSSGGLDFSTGEKNSSGQTIDKETLRIARSMNSLAKELKWDPAEIDRLDSALKNITWDGAEVTKDIDIISTWKHWIIVLNSLNNLQKNLHR